jgi:quercetin dioxygenase-like cupin family protein
MKTRKKSAVLRTRRLAGRILRFLIGAEDETLREFADTSKSGRAAKTLVKQGPLRVTLVALKRGTALPPHHVDGPVSIQVLRGYLELTTDKGAIPLPSGILVTLEAGLTHAATAVEDSAILITFAMT